MRLEHAPGAKPLVCVGLKGLHTLRRLFHFPCYRCGAYTRAELISTKGKTLRGIWRELTEARTRYAQFNIKYVHVELLYEPGFKSFPEKSFRTHELLVGRGHFSDEMVLNLFISSAVTKVGSFNLICKYQNYLPGAY